MRLFTHAPAAPPTPPAPMVSYRHLMDFTQQAIEDGKGRKTLTEWEVGRVDDFRKRLTKFQAADSAGVKAAVDRGKWGRRAATLASTVAGTALFGSAMWQSISMGMGSAAASTVGPMVGVLLVGGLAMWGVALWRFTVSSDLNKFKDQVGQLEPVIAAQVQQAGVCSTSDDAIKFDTSPARKIFKDTLGDWGGSYQRQLPAPEIIVRDVAEREKKWRELLPADRQKVVVGVLCTTWAADSASREFGPTMDYVRAVMRSGGEPRLVFYARGPVEEQMKRLDAMLIPGGPDIHPKFYGQQPGPNMSTHNSNPTFDEFELSCIRAAYDSKLPMLGICRGEQLMNVAGQGTLTQDIDSEHQRPHGAPKVQHRPGGLFPKARHDIAIAEGARLADILGARMAQVNSLHHQCIGELSPMLKATAWARDNVVEAVERKGVPEQLGVQFHPELLSQDEERFQRLFTDLVRNGASFRPGRLARNKAEKKAAEAAAAAAGPAGAAGSAAAGATASTPTAGAARGSVPNVPPQAAAADPAVTTGATATVAPVAVGPAPGSSAGSGLAADVGRGGEASQPAVGRGSVPTVIRSTPAPSVMPTTGPTQS